MNLAPRKYAAALLPALLFACPDSWTLAATAPSIGTPLNPAPHRTTLGNIKDENPGEFRDPLNRARANFQQADFIRNRIIDGFPDLGPPDPPDVAIPASVTGDLRTSIERTIALIPSAWRSVDSLIKPGGIGGVMDPAIRAALLSAQKSNTLLTDAVSANEAVLRAKATAERTLTLAEETNRTMQSLITEWAQPTSNKASIVTRAQEAKRRLEAPVQDAKSEADEAVTKSERAQGSVQDARTQHTTATQGLAPVRSGIQALEGQVNQMSQVVTSLASTTDVALVRIRQEIQMAHTRYNGYLTQLRQSLTLLEGGLTSIGTTNTALANRISGAGGGSGGGPIIAPLPSPT